MAVSNLMATIQWRSVLALQSFIDCSVGWLSLIAWLEDRPLRSDLVCAVADNGVRFGSLCLFSPCRFKLIPFKLLTSA
jgi:hypothetical protein